MVEGPFDAQVRLPTVARLYYRRYGDKRYTRASVRRGPGEPLCLVSVAVAEAERLYAALVTVRRNFADVPLNANGKAIWTWIDGGCIGDMPNVQLSGGQRPSA